MPVRARFAAVSVEMVMGIDVERDPRVRRSCACAAK